MGSQTPGQPDAARDPKNGGCLWTENEPGVEPGERGREHQLRSSAKVLLAHWLKSKSVAWWLSGSTEAPICGRLRLHGSVGKILHAPHGIS